MKMINKHPEDNGGLTPIEMIVNTWKHQLKDNQALRCALNITTGGKGYLLCVVTENKDGYKATDYILNTNDYNEANGWIENANRIIFNRPLKKTLSIIRSSMRL